VANDTHIKLRNWDEGSEKAEMMCGEISRLEGYAQVSPQSPFGGPDGKKDLLMLKGGQLYVGAAYFPRNDTEFKIIRKKFREDLKGALTHKPYGFVFFTNQRLTPKEKSDLEKWSVGKIQDVVIYSITDLSIILDSATGIGIRFRYLGIAISESEQAAAHESSVAAVRQNTDALRRLEKDIAAIREYQEKFFEMLLRPASPSAQFPVVTSAVPGLSANAAMAFQSGIANIHNGRPPST
jgi:hypothetical protein